MNTNEALWHLYDSKWSDLCKVLDENGLDGYEYNPLLLGIKDVEDFDSADIKVMLFGQDMSEGGWYQYDRQNQSLKECMMSIRTFDNKIGAIDLNGKRGTKSMGRGMNRFIDALNARFPDKKIRYIWNDLVRLGRNIKGNSHQKLLEQIELEYFNVIRDEVNIIRPQILVFFTGPSKFWEIKLQQKLGISKLNYLPVHSWKGNIRQLAQLELEKETYPAVKYVFRTYHPCAWEGRIHVKHKDLYKAIVDSIIL